MKRVAILTRTSTINFGTILQNFALQKAIEALGYSALTVDDSVPRELFSQGGDTLHKSVISLKEYIYGLYDHLKETLKNRRYHKTGVLCKRFKKKYIRYYRVITLEALKDDFDVFISGSDQIWSDKAEPELFSYFMQDFVPDDKTKLSYAVSVGAYFDQINEEIVRQSLERMDSISVREPSSHSIIQKYYEGEIRMDCDPVLLIGMEEWKKLAGKRKIKSKYIFCYFLSDNGWYYDKIRDCARSLEINEIFLFENKNSDFNECRKIRSCSPSEFLNYILYSDFVITDSFHASLFSIIFNKEFNVFQRYNDDINIHQNGRIISVLSDTGLLSRYILPEMALNLESTDYDIINPTVKQMSQRSCYEIKKRLDKGRGYNGKEMDGNN